MKKNIPSYCHHTIVQLDMVLALLILVDRSNQRNKVHHNVHLINLCFFRMCLVDMGDEYQESTSVLEDIQIDQCSWGQSQDVVQQELLSRMMLDARMEHHQQ